MDNLYNSQKYKDREDIHDRAMLSILNWDTSAYRPHFILLVSFVL
jgi:hypothetical protein